MENTEYHPITNSTAYAITNACHVVHDWAKKKGWWDQPRNKGELLALMHSELSEALEYLRAKVHVECPHCAHLNTEIMEHRSLQSLWGCNNCNHTFMGPVDRPPAMDDKLPDVPGEHAELADTVIRIFDYCGAFGIDLGEVIRRKHEFNITRPVRHGKGF